MCFKKLSFKPVSLETIMVSNISVMFKKIKNGKKMYLQVPSGYKMAEVGESPASSAPEHS